MQLLRTPEQQFSQLTDYPFEPHYTEIDVGAAQPLRIHHLDEGPKDGPIVLCLHGQPAWSYLYRKMVPLLVAAGLRVIAPDLPGFGRSDKPAAREDYSYQRQVDWMSAWLAANDFGHITFFGQDWGGLIGLRMIVDQPARFDRVVISNTGLPYNPDGSPEIARQVRAFRANAPTPTLPAMAKALRAVPESRELAFAHWQKYCWETADLPIGFMMGLSIDPPPRWQLLSKLLLHRFAGRPLRLASPLAAAYEAPFPTPEFKMGPRAMPSMVPTLCDDPSLAAQGEAWAFFRQFDKPFLCAFTDDDPITRGGEQPFIEAVPGAKRQTHRTIKGGGHFVQEQRPAELAAIIAEFARQP